MLTPPPRDVQEARARASVEEQRRIDWEQSVSAGLDDEVRAVKDALVQTAAGLRERITVETNTRAQVCASHLVSVFQCSPHARQAVLQAREAAEQLVARSRADAERIAQDMYDARLRLQLRLIRYVFPLCCRTVRHEDTARALRDRLAVVAEAGAREEAARQAAAAALRSDLEAVDVRARDAIAAQSRQAAQRVRRGPNFRCFMCFP
jgi:hypothetical protein